MTAGGNLICLNRNVMGMMVPSGASIMLHCGTEVRVVQDCGDHLTVDVFGNLARISQYDVDALGREASDPLAELPEGATPKEAAWFMLKRVYDPEIPVNIVDLGLIYSMKVIGEAVDLKAEVVMTLTSPACGMGPMLVQDVEHNLLKIKEIIAVSVDLVFDPPWDRSMMSEEAQLACGMLGG